MLVLESLEKAEVEVADELLGEAAQAPLCVRRRTRLCTHACMHVFMYSHMHSRTHSRAHVLTPARTPRGGARYPQPISRPPAPLAGPAGEAPGEGRRSGGHLGLEPTTIPALLRFCTLKRQVFTCLRRRYKAEAARVPPGQACVLSFAESLAKLFSLMDPNSPERVAFVSRALKWSSGGSGKLGHPRLHQLLALTLWKGRRARWAAPRRPQALGPASATATHPSALTTLF